MASAWPEREKEGLICIMAMNQQQQRVQPYRYEPTLTSLNAGWQELFLPSNEAVPSGRIKYEYGMKNEDYHTAP